MAFFAAVGLIFIIVLIVVQIFWNVQLTEVGIHVLNPAGGGFMDTSNFWAWVVVFILLVLICLLIKFFFRWLNILLASGLGLLFSVPLKKRSYIELEERVGFAVLLVWMGWLMATLFLTAGTMNFFAQNPQLNSWLADGDWLAHVLTYLAIFGLVCPGRREKS